MTLSSSDRLDRRLEPAICVVIVAAAGFGKTTLLEELPSAGLGWHDARALVATASVAGQAIDSAFSRPDAAVPARVVIDDFSLVDSSERTLIAEAISRLPDETAVVLASRAPIDDALRRAIGRPVVEMTAAELALTVDEVDRILRDERGIADRDLAVMTREITGGWPGLVARVASLADDRPVDRELLLAELAAPSNATAGWLDRTVLDALSPQARSLLDALCDLTPVSPGLIEALDIEDGVRAYRELTTVGLLAPASGCSRSDDFWTVVPLVAACRRRQAAQSDGRLQLAAAEWYVERGEHRAAARAFAAAGEIRRLRDVIEASGDAITASGGSRDVLAWCELLADGGPSRDVAAVAANAARVAGDASAVQRWFTLLAGATDDEEADVDVAWRRAALHYQRAEYADAVAVCEAARVGEPSSAAARTLAYLSSSLLMLGKVESSVDAAERALASARASYDDGALGLAHVACAFTETGARRDNHLAAALAAAERAGDTVLAARVLGNQSHGLICEADYANALEAAQRAIRVGECGGPPGAFVSALQNAGDALTQLGRFDEARASYERSLGLSRRLGMTRTANALLGLAELDFQLGYFDRSRAAYEQVVDLARDNNEQQALVPALARLAALLAADEDLERARASADEAVGLAAHEQAASAYAAAARVALAEGDQSEAQLWSRRSADAAREVDHQPALADALELVAIASTDDVTFARAAAEALVIWDRGGAIVSADRVRILIGSRSAATRVERSAARSASRALRQRGILTIQYGDLGPASARVRIRLLGGFDVVVDGDPVPLPAWKSRQARSLLKILAARRGRPVSRGELCELLWPDDDPQRTGHRLSVLLSAVRTVLDPTKQLPVDHYIAADLTGLRLDIAHAAVDLEDFLHDARHATEAADAGDLVAARDLLADLDAAYRGDPFDDEPYEEWADGVREMTRAVWSRLTRLSARLAAQVGDVDHAVVCFVRLLGADIFDEPSHRALVGMLMRAGRHGEARRAFDRWTEAMRSIGAPLPSRSVLRPQAEQDLRARSARTAPTSPARLTMTPQ